MSAFCEPSRIPSPVKPPSCIDGHAEASSPPGLHYMTCNLAGGIMIPCAESRNKHGSRLKWPMRQVLGCERGTTGHSRLRRQTQLFFHRYQPQSHPRQCNQRRWSCKNVESGIASAWLTLARKLLAVWNRWNRMKSFAQLTSRKDRHRCTPYFWIGQLHGRQWRG